MKPEVESVLVMLDPFNAGSTIAGSVATPVLKRRSYGKGLWYIRNAATLQLSDCSRSIHWGFEREEDYEQADPLEGQPLYNIEKLDRAIYALAEYRVLLVRANHDYATLRQLMTTRNAEIEATEEKQP